jgi:hypothetical protein
MLRTCMLPAVVIGLTTLASTSLLAFQRPGGRNAEAGPTAEARAAAATTYENLANAIIAIEKTEDELVKTILVGYHADAVRHLRQAMRDDAGRKAHFEAAAAEISNIANEGDAPIRAIRQRLAQAGHTHNTDVETKEDYMFVTNREKKELLAMAQKVAQMNADAQPDAIRAAIDDLGTLVEKVLAPE